MSDDAIDEHLDVIAALVTETAASLRDCLARIELRMDILHADLLIEQGKRLARIEEKLGIARSKEGPK